MTAYFLVRDASSETPAPSPCRIEIQVSPDGQYSFLFALGDGPLEPVPAQAVQMQAGVISLLLNGHSFEARLDVAPQGTAILLNGRRYEFSSYDPRSLKSRRAAAHSDDGPRTLHSPMPGRVLRILLAPGDPVKAQQGVLVVEAMKMQNELKSPKDGTVSAILVKEGDTVTAGQSLATIT